MVWKRVVKTEYEKESLLAFGLVCSTNSEQKMGEEWVSLMESRKAIKSGRMKACPLEPLKENARLLLLGFELVCSTSWATVKGI